MSTESIRRGTVLGGRYRLDDLLSENAGARFWRGTDAVLGRSVAVNVLPLSDPRLPGLMDAARSSATVTDSRLLRVLDCDEQEQAGWVVNEWGEGASLDNLLHQGPLPPIRAAWVAREVAEMLSAAHQHKIAHGRLAPEAVLITDSGAVKVIGFAVSAAIEGRDAQPGAAQRWGYGTPGPLEADVIDLAGILYAGLTGRWPGLAPSALAPAPYDARGPLRPRQVRAGVPRMLDAICERVLRKEAHEHLMPMESAYEVFAALTEHIGDPTTAAPVDLGSMHREPSVGLDRERLRDALAGAARVNRYQRQGSQALPAGQFSADQLSTDQLSTDQLSADQLSADQLSADHLPIAMPVDLATLGGSPAETGAPATPVERTPVDQASSAPTPTPPSSFVGFDPHEQPAPLPPFVDSPERPLFADTVRPPAAGSEPEPAADADDPWPFGDQDEPPADGGDGGGGGDGGNGGDGGDLDGSDRQHSWIVLALVSVLITAALVAGIVALHP